MIHDDSQKSKVVKEKVQMTEPQEEFISPESVPSHTLAEEQDKKKTQNKKGSQQGGG